jgi:NDP-sugar pyrophosphorylase family protein
LDKHIEGGELYECKVKYLKAHFLSAKHPWELLSGIRELIEKLIEEGIEGFELVDTGVLVGEGTLISPTAVIEPPTVIGKNCTLRPGAYIRGCVVTGEGCVIGNSTEIKGSILLDLVQAPHYNYIGDSVLGNRAHLGAGVILSNLKGDQSEVTVHADADYPTGRRKLGAMLGDGADIGCGSVLNPGTVICRGSRVYPLQSVRGCIPPNSLLKPEGIFPLTDE